MAAAKSDAAASQGDHKKPFYLFDDDQACRVETIQMAMRGIADLVSNEAGADPSVDHEVNRANVAAIFEWLAQSLEDAIGLKGRKSAHLSPAEIKGSVQ